VSNTGRRDGAAVVQLYVGFPASTGEPPNQLKGFAKVFVKAGGRERAKMSLDASSFSTWSTADHAWVVQPGEYRLRLGTSSRDLAEETTVVLKRSRRAQLAGAGDTVPSRIDEGWSDPR